MSSDPKQTINLKQDDLFMVSPYGQESTRSAVAKKTKADLAKENEVKPTEKASKKAAAQKDKPNKSGCNVFPERFLAKGGQLRALAFGHQSRFNLLGHVANYIDQIPFFAAERTVEMVNGAPVSTTIDGRIVQSKEVCIDYKLTITPGARFAKSIRVTDSGKTVVEYEPVLHNFSDHAELVYFKPGPREDLVDKALRRIAQRQAQPGSRKIAYCARFTIYDIRRELQSFGHWLQWKDIRHAIHVLSNTTFTFSIMSGNEPQSSGRHVAAYSAKGLTSTYITSLEWGSRVADSEIYNPERDHCFCYLNELISHTLSTESYQAFQYNLYMRMSSFMARKLFSVLSLEWRNSNTEQPYRRSLNELLLRFQIGLSSRLSNDVRTMKKALDELVSFNIIARYEIEKVSRGVGRYNQDYIITLFPTSQFVQTQIEAVKDRKIREARHALNRPSLQLTFE